MVADGAPSSKTSIFSFGITDLPLGNVCDDEMKWRLHHRQLLNLALLPG